MHTHYAEDTLLKAASSTYRYWFYFKIDLTFILDREKEKKNIN